MKTLLATSLVLLVLCSQLASAQNCPDEVTECDVDPCQDQECNRFFSATCTPNFCHGLCTANFFWRGQNVTDKCETITCDTRDPECGENRQCMEMVVPPTCPEDQPVCRQYLRTRCILMVDEVDRPMTCSDVSCEEGMACRLRIRTEDFPPVVRCLPAERVSECVVGTCDDGFTCVDDGPSVRCEVTTTTTPTTDATTTDATTTTITPTSTTPTTFPTCDQLNCSILGLICNDNGTIPVCDLPTSCDQLSCLPGTICTLDFSFPFCVESLTCDQLNCSRFLICNENGTRPVCEIPTSCDQLSCQPGTICTLDFSFPVCFPESQTCDQLNCGILGLICNDNGTIPFCALPTSCDQLSCPFGANCTLVADSIPVCDTPPACEGYGCEVFNHACDEGENGPTCRRPSTCEELDPICKANDPADACSLVGGAPQCSTNDSCDTLDCPEFERCVFRPSPTPFPFCFPTTLARTCDQLVCPADLPSCLLLTVEDESLAQCFDSNTTLGGLATCEDISCDAGEGCLNLTQDGIIVFPFCTVLDCAGDGDCSFNDTCVENSLIPESTSVCVPPEFQPSITTTNCEERAGNPEECEEPLACQEAVLDGNVIGSFCTFPASIPIDSCDGVECAAEGEICLLITIGDMSVGQCSPDDILESLSFFRPLVFL